MRHQARAVVAVAGVLVLGVAARSAAQTLEIVPRSDGSIAVRAVDVPLEDLLKALPILGPGGRLILRNDVGQRRVTVTLDQATVLSAAIAALEAAGVDYVLGETRVVAGEAGFRGNPAAAAEVVASPAVDARDEDRVRRDERADEDESDSEAVRAERARIASEGPGRIATVRQALAAPPGGNAPGAWVSLPFPASENGGTAGAMRPSGPAALSLPFPGAAAGPAQRPAAVVTDPRVLQLMHELSAKPPPAR